jgi:hypothetical protein
MDDGEGGEMFVSRDKWTMDKHFRRDPGGGERHIAAVFSSRVALDVTGSYWNHSSDDKLTNHQGCAAAERYTGCELLMS